MTYKTFAASIPESDKYAVLNHPERAQALLAVIETEPSKCSNRRERALWREKAVEKLLCKRPDWKRRLRRRRKQGEKEAPESIMLMLAIASLIVNLIRLWMEFKKSKPTLMQVSALKAEAEEEAAK